MRYKVNELDNVIHERSRLLILTLLLKEGKLSFSELKERLNLTDGNLISHLRILEDNELINVEKKFVKRKPKTFYSLSEKGRKKFMDYLEKIKDSFN
ncbi:MAG: transcriptional regulator [Caldisericia bacterium]|nr:transcriptional regulator [Caldisericia bacterium]